MGDGAKAKALYSDVYREYQSAVRDRPGDWDRHMALGLAAAGLGLKDEAVAEGRRTVELLPISRDAFAGPEYLGYLAQVYVAVGENDQAIALLQQLMSIPAGLSMSSALLKLDPVWDPIAQGSALPEADRRWRSGAGTGAGQAMSNKPSFFAELQRRHVYKIGAAYVVAGWLVVQVVTQVFPIFNVSALAQRIIVLVIIAGFPVTLVLTWLFDITSHGVVRTGDLPEDGRTARSATRTARDGP